MFNEPTNHPLIPRKNTVIIEKKQVTVHTEDRDTRLKADGIQVENQNKFSIQLPDHFENIAYVQLKNIQIPTYYINIADKYKNNKVKIAYRRNNNTIQYTVVIPDGFYTPSTLLAQLYVSTLKKYDNKEIISFIDTTSIDVGKLLFNNDDRLANIDITFTFENLTYNDIPQCEYINGDLLHDFSNQTKWGLGYILGFDKSNTFRLDYDADGLIDSVEIDNNQLMDGPTPIILNSAPNDIRLDYLKTIYLEVNDFNTISEKKPDTGNRNDTFNGGYYGLGGAALAKIPIPGIHDGIIPSFNVLSSQMPSENLESKKLFLNSFETRVHKLNFVFRDHRGRLIDFRGQDFTFTLEFGLVREVPERMLNILNFTE